MEHRNGLCGLDRGGAGYLPLLCRLRAEFRRVAAVAATSPQTGADQQQEVSCGDEEKANLEEESTTFQRLLEALGGRSKV